ncbi:MAG: SPASM domain-containing protein [Dialister invisus]
MFCYEWEAAFVDVHGDIYACSSLMGKSEYKWAMYTGRCPENVRKIGTFIRNSMKACRMCECFSLCGGGCFSRWLDKNGQVRCSEAECALKKFFIKRYLRRQEKAI